MDFSKSYQYISSISSHVKHQWNLQDTWTWPTNKAFYIMVHDIHNIKCPVMHYLALNGMEGEWKGKGVKCNKELFSGHHPDTCCREWGNSWNIPSKDRPMKSPQLGWPISPAGNWHAYLPNMSMTYTLLFWCGQLMSDNISYRI